MSFVSIPESVGTTGDPPRAVRHQRRAGLEGVNKEAREGREEAAVLSLPDFSRPHPHPGLTSRSFPTPEHHNQCRSLCKTKSGLANPLLRTCLGSPLHLG